MPNKNLIKIAKEVINDEINSLKKLRSNIGRSFEQTVKAIINCKNGKVVVSGVGKSGIIGKKWSATFSSTGTPSFFLDATNASHGDMGQIASNDIVILISNSGQSEELKNIINHTSRNKNIKLIGITSKKNSILYKNSDLNFVMPNIREAGPENIIPTSSTSVQLALGDAIAIACMRYKNFTKFDFKKIHPSGTLSIKLKTVSDLMIKGKKLPAVSENINLSKAIKIISNTNLGVLIIKKKNGNTSGIITDGDLRRNIKGDFLSLEAREIMSLRPKLILKDELVVNALNLMNINKITCLFIVNNKRDKKPTGVIHIHDCIRYAP